MSKRRPKKCHGQGAVFIDPVDCGSSIRWKVVDDGYGKQPRPTCEIALTDCNRSISWYQDCDEDGIAKINKAIKVLLTARAMMKKHKYVKIEDADTGESETEE